ncbi:aminopeptidase N-like [Leptodactylus fuscus]|uniref:aminopeptidase N-like n=1 Tax=Leptodactylus fuscus TaxID=238119 RepID=UPI003F4E7A35
MAKGFYVTKLVASVCIFFAIAAVATIIALAVVYVNEKNNNKVENGGTTTTATSTSTITITTTSIPTTASMTTTTTPTITSTPTTTSMTTTTTSTPTTASTTTTTTPTTTSTPTTTPTTTTSGTTTSTVKPTTTTPVSNEVWDKYRLPGHLVPEHYDVDLRPILTINAEGLYIFHGVSKAYFTCKTPTRHVIIHSNKLNYTADPVLTDEDGNVISTNKYFLVEKTNYLVLPLNVQLQAGTKYILHTTFVGELADDLAGFYHSEYVEDGETKIIATTQMHPADARKAFPCFDEPALKATFSITLRHKPDYVALSNMNLLSETTEQWEGEEWIVSTFDQTPKMSTYLVAFIVSQFCYVGDDRVKIWGRKKAIVDENQGAYALNITRPILEFFEKYYNVPYPLPKSDQVALPDFSVGAMENWGLVTYRETSLLYDIQESSISNKERVLTIIAHELAHQWFGNLVTIRWWTDPWLNEGFASYVEYLGADYAEPTWNIKDLIVLYDVHRVMAVDALASSHPLSSREEDVNTPSEISALFDSISYSKGASVIRMLSTFITEDLFAKGLCDYLNKFAYENTVYTNLWDSLQDVYDNETNAVTLPASIEAIMNTWVLQMGFPVVTINTADGSITQKHFLLDPNSTVTAVSPYNYTWYVPISYITKTSDLRNVWLTKERDTNNEFRITGDNWLLANIDVTGYYRVNYDDGNWNRLFNQLETNLTVIPVINRAQIIDDAFNLARAQIVSTTRALETTKFLVNDVEYMPWQAALSGLSYFTQMFDRSDVYGPMKAYMRQQTAPLYNYFKGLTNDWTVRPEGLTEQYNEVNAINTACSYGITECTDLASKLFREWRNTSINGIHPNLRSSIYCNAIANGGEEEWNFLWDQFRNTTNAQEADKLRAGLACSREPWILNRLLEFSLDPTKIRKQDCLTTITNVANNVIGQALAWDFMKNNWQQLVNDIGAGMSFGNLINGVTRRFASESELQQLRQFKQINTDNNVGFGSASRALEQAIEKTQANIIWVNQNKAAVKEWFENAIKP